MTARPSGASVPCVAAIAVVILAPWSAATQDCSLEIASYSSSGIQGLGDSSFPDLSRDGRYLVFQSGATNLVPLDTNGSRDVFLRDLTAGTTVLASVAMGGIQGDSISSNPAVSADGRYVAFDSFATNLLPGDTNGKSDIYLFDRQVGAVIERLTMGVSGQEPDKSSYFPAISDDGSKVVFDSNATNLVFGDTNGEGDVFLHDRTTGVTKRVSVDSGGAEGNGWSYAPQISGDGRWVAFMSWASNFVAGDTNGAPDVFRVDLVTGVNELVSADASGVIGNTTSQLPHLSGDGRYIAFNSYATNLVQPGPPGFGDVYVKDMLTGAISLVSKTESGGFGGMLSTGPRLTTNGRKVAFASSSSLVSGVNVTGDTPYVHDMDLGLTLPVIRQAVGGGAPSFGSSAPDISGEGLVVTFSSLANNLVAGDGNPGHDVFLATCPTWGWSFCGPAPGSNGCAASIQASGSNELSANQLTLSASGFSPQTAGCLVYATQGVGQGSFAGSSTCLNSPLSRTPLQFSTGFGGSCSGAFSFDLASWIAAGNDPALQAGQAVFAQFVCRDRGAPTSTLQLSDGTALMLLP